MSYYVYYANYEINQLSDLSQTICFLHYGIYIFKAIFEGPNHFIKHK